ncbi:MAG: type I restriction endonuclease, partial [Halobacteriovoraceae bacterium]|nr:type I restriction endonuclease [Halobacteriovoraceae bacterium]
MPERNNMITEEQLEQSCISWFQGLGWDYECGHDIAPDSDNPKRNDYKEAILTNTLRDSLAKINPGIPHDKIEEAVSVLARLNSPILEVNNRQFHRFINDGIPIDIRKEGRDKGDFVK